MAGPHQSPPDSLAPAKFRPPHGSPHPGPGDSKVGQLGRPAAETENSKNVRVEFGFGRGSGGAKLLFYLALCWRNSAKLASFSGNQGERKFGIGSGSAVTRK